MSEIKFCACIILVALWIKQALWINRTDEEHIHFAFYTGAIFFMCLIIYFFVDTTTP